MTLIEAPHLKKKRLPIIVIDHRSLVAAASGKSEAMAQIAGPVQEFGEGKSNAERINVARGNLVNDRLVIENYGPIDEGLSNETQIHALESQAACFIADWARQANNHEVCLWISPKEDESLGDDRNYVESRFVVTEALGNNQFEFRGFPGQQNLNDCWQGVCQLTYWMTNFDTPPPPAGVEESQENLLRRQPFILQTGGEKDWLNLLLRVGFIDKEIYQTIESGLDWQQVETARKEVETVIEQNRHLIFNSQNKHQQRALILGIQSQLKIKVTDRACSASNSPFNRLYKRLENGEKAWGEKEGLVHCPCGLWIPKNQTKCPCGLHNPHVSSFSLN